MATDSTREQAAEVLAVMVERMQRYEQLIDDLREGRIEPAAFRRQAVTTGLILERDGAWIFDVPNTRWLHYDGVELKPVEGTSARPSSARRRRTK